MLLRTLLLLFSFFAIIQLQSQACLPILRAGNPQISIRDGQILRTDYWTASPDIDLDIYTADRTSEQKTVTFYSDKDSIRFQLAPQESINFVILLNGVDSCYTRLSSGIRYQPAPYDPYQSDTIPFELSDHNNIIVKALLNNHYPLRLMFHTDANDVSITREAVQRLEDLGPSDTIAANSWGGGGQASFTNNNQLHIGPFYWQQVRVWQNERSGPGTDGKFGPQLFGNKVIEINYDLPALVIHSRCPALQSGYEKMDMQFRRSSMFVSGTCQIGDQAYANEFLLHSGYGGSLLLDDEFVQDNGIGEQLQVQKERQLTDSYGNVIVTKDAVLPGFQLGSKQFSGLPVSFFEGAIGRQRMSVMGGALLKNFNIIIDFQQASVYFQKRAG